MKVCITGAAGFLASHVADVVAEMGHDVVVLDSRPSETFETRVVDICDLEQTVVGTKGVDTICHLAAVGDVYLAGNEPWTAARVNAVGTANIMEAARRNGIGKVAYASTWEVYGEAEYEPIDEKHPTRPDNPYSITKLAGEHLALAFDRLSDVPCVALRLGTAYGTRMRPNSVFSLFVDRAARGEPIKVQGSGAQGRQFVHARDVGRAFALAIESPLRGEVFNIVGSENVTIRQLAEAVCAVLPTSLEFGDARPGDVPSSIVSSEFARDRLGWVPQVDFTVGLEELVAFRTSKIRQPEAV
jgi:UDP-glucose 4-epimerase